MADARRTRHHTHETNALSYGHLGTATYDEQSHDWTFLRQLQGDQDPSRGQRSTSRPGLLRFQLVGERTVDCAAEVPRRTDPAEQRSMNGSRLQNTFLKNVADAALALTSSPASASSAEVQRGNTEEDVSSASYLAIGHARPPYQSGMHNNDPSTAVVALAAESHQNILRLVGFENCQVAVLNEAGLEDVCTLPSITKRVVGHWCESADPIIQVSSAKQANGTHFLVVKPGGTTILRPTSADSTRDPLGLQSTDIPSEVLLNACPIVTIPTSRTGGNPHVHAAFNPRDQNSVAVVDSSGQWSVWKLIGRKARSARILYKVHLLSSNNLATTGGPAPPTTDTSRGDGWHRVCWLIGSEASRERLLVCSRRMAAVFDREGQFLGRVDMRLGPTSDRNRILDIKNSQRRGDHLFVLSTSRLMVFSSSTGSWKERDPVEPLELVCSWNHYRDRANPGLRMSTVEFPTDSVVLIYSSSSQVAVTYRFGNDSINSSVVSLQDPSIFQLPRLLKERMKAVSDVVLYPVNFSAQNQTSNAVDYGLVKLIACTNEGEIIEAIYKYGLPQFGHAAELIGGLPALASRRRSTSTQRRSKHGTTGDLDDFVVSDVTEASAVPLPAKTAQGTASDLGPFSLHFRNWQRLSDHLAVKDSKSRDVPFGTCLRQAVELFERVQGRDDTTSVRLIADLVDSFHILDVEEDSQRVESWVDMLLLHNNVATEFVAFPAHSNESRGHLMSVYNNLVNTYVESLPEQTTARNRVNRERFVRQIVAPTVFGTFMLKTRPSVKLVESPQPRSASIPHSALPSLSAGFDADDQQQLQTLGIESSVSNEEPAVARLRQYTTFAQQVPPLLLDRNPGLSAVLEHLPVSIEEDPADYSYQQTNQKLKLVQEQLAAESLDPKQRNKALKSAVRLRRKLEKNLLMSQEVMLQRTLVPSIRTGTALSNLPAREVQSSQAAAPGLGNLASQEANASTGLTMTQPERGAFGTRQAAKKGKKRRAGF
ncbi:hypothetical protein A1O7_06330 [Cladophialophora yegresii CBS 114405]|uniref:RNA polymerase I-specific transcription initiation factor RRN6-like protein n=1 Tax=Cladophialophora yegresii CBS 114405 TaxID=1182544 RepID=W9W1P4_9EURO|nr:uncharacterized protein A1O7_06330 [Cladophialophora yegresii CBS 114405]EXJ58900.1 hypothetical protein A1O7_06330 [Cladophialophora yegresii CBS 114405]